MNFLVGLSLGDNLLMFVDALREPVATIHR